MARVAWPLAGVVAGIAGLAVSHALTMALSLRPNPLVSISEWLVGHLPDWLEDLVHQLTGIKDAAPSATTGAELLEPYVIAFLFLGFLGVAAVAGQLSRRGWWQAIPLQVAVIVIAAIGMVGRFTLTSLTVTPVIAGGVTWIVLTSFVAGPLQRARASALRMAATPADDGPPVISAERMARWWRFDRRDFVVRAAVAGFGGLALWLYGGNFAQKRRRVDQTRRLLNLPIHDRAPRPEFRIDIDGVQPWRTKNENFFNEQTGFVDPVVELSEWRLRIHGLVERELVLTYQDLIDRQIVESWTTLVNVNNPVGGDLIGNAWWSGVLIGDLLTEAGLDPTADAVLQRSVDGWTCVTPLTALTDRRNAMLAVGMNGVPLPLEQGYPVRSIVPGLYGHVSDCKFLTELKVTRFADDRGFANEQQGFAERGPIKVGSRIDTPHNGDDLAPGTISIGGSAWAPNRGIAAVEVAVDDGPWLLAELARVPNADTWVQWGIAVELASGSHRARVRATAADGEVQTGVVSGTHPDGASGWHEVGFDVS
ncbi:molybdopterin-dependent oxidoreductase [Nocardioides sp. Bht2]|uniref:molybdopterin-dependent oxidoreductase n=1 Tax=Nocardioides sp. Bht2 TaxID=3392297 RepID=UPI0039B5FA68